ncbi:MAG: anaerobic ribonucleoside-triphosphate reductase activating protein [Eubacteriales bacterium]|nr:anaerobic ribonucleoside-triphosphate reductase activating protein [Eubacteriales bacterium]
MAIRIAGWQKLSLIDYPGKMAAVIFLAGCNMRCHYCHNYHILDTRANCLDFAMVLAELKKRTAWLDAVVVSGGEPTVSPTLLPILRQLRSLGLLIKLDTNGTRPEIVRTVVEAGLVDYVALDIKAPASKYRDIAGLPIDKVLMTAAYLRSQKRIPYLFRTTVSPRLTVGDLQNMGQTIIAGAPCWQIQQCRTVGAYSDAEIRQMAESLKKYALYIVVTGV